MKALLRAGTLVSARSAEIATALSAEFDRPNASPARDARSAEVEIPSMDRLTFDPVCSEIEAMPRMSV
ncbi:hypothetical protein E4V01_24050 [Methylorubrum sp. Q1]|uniref:hypothetical protein n=1 Tax=Methylorubrum sp. Q1 TaxID=2562453 RepID=UPI001103B0B7|nr:hypothetical protein [Methylorubrum sp. Q1]TFZ54988.1 hypothetical protein E4V01_24050 [Methylorubrum sp. Q1]